MSVFRVSLVFQFLINYLKLSIQYEKQHGSCSFYQFYSRLLQLVCNISYFLLFPARPLGLQVLIFLSADIDSSSISMTVPTLWIRLRTARGDGGTGRHVKSDSPGLAHVSDVAGSGLWTEWNTSPWNSCSSVARLNANLSAQECKYFAGTLKFGRFLKRRAFPPGVRRTPPVAAVNICVLTLTGHTAACLYWSGSWDVWNVSCSKNVFMLKIVWHQTNEKGEESLF